MPANAETGRDVFDRLDAESTYFEQFMLQDVRSNRNAAAVFGGEALFEKLAEFMRKAELTASLMQFSIGEVARPENSNNGEMESILRRCRVPLSAVADVDCQGSPPVETGTIERNGIDLPFSENLVWMEAHVSSAENPVNATTQILDFVFGKLQAHALQSRKAPRLLVTFRTGQDCDVCAPFKSGLAESSIHVPLWIRGDILHACRVQALAGSFDLLPTITEFLGGTNIRDGIPATSELHHDTSAEQLAEDASTLSLAPRNLAILCGAPQVCSNRLLPLHGDGWRAARSEEFLLVIADHCNSVSGGKESDGNNSEESSRRLYVKPEDRFNVNDVSGTYATAADELARLLN